MKTKFLVMMLFVAFGTSVFAQEEEMEVETQIEEEVEVETQDQDLMADAETAKMAFVNADAAIEEHLSNAAGYVIFPNVGKGALVVGVSSGNGVVYSKGQVVGQADLKKVDIGLQAGGKAASELIIFKTEEAFEKFKNNEFEFAADASAVVLKSGKEAEANYSDGVAVFALSKAGLMAEVSVGGQKFTFKPIY